MPKLTELKEAINKVLTDNFQDIELYSSEVKEGFNRPAFFTTIIPVTMSYDSKNYKSTSQMIIINYFGENGTEIENLNMNDALIQAFGMTLQVGQRHFLCKNLRSEVTDTVLQFKFDLDYHTRTVNGEKQKTMNELDIKMNKE